MIIRLKCQVGTLALRRFWNHVTLTFAQIWNGSFLYCGMEKEMTLKYLNHHFVVKASFSYALACLFYKKYSLIMSREKPQVLPFTYCVKSQRFIFSSPPPFKDAMEIHSKYVSISSQAKWKPNVVLRLETNTCLTFSYLMDFSLTL